MASASAQVRADSPDLDPVPVPEPSDKAMRFYRSGNVVWAIGKAWSWFVPAALLFSGLSAQMRRWAQRVGRQWFVVVVIFFLLYAGLTYLAGMPLAFYGGYIRLHDYGLSNQTFAKWLGDSLKALLVVLIAGSALLWLPYWVLRRSPRRWWLICSAGAVPLLIFVMLIAPIWIDPWFNQFGPLKNLRLEKDILTLADRAGIDGSRVFEVNKSVDTEAVNAYVTGVLGTKRIVLWDTLIAKLDRPELLFVMGHEMGHYVLGHVRTGVGLACLCVWLTLYALHRAGGRLLRRMKPHFGFEQLSDIASLPLLALFFQVSLFVLTPAGLAISRHMEHEADRFGLEITRDNHAAAAAFVKLQEENLSNPRPGWFYVLWRGSHPALGDRIDFCNTYRPWITGEALKCETLFKTTN
jgi:STE24 endopeptidase